jgi:hypothetical protein
MGQGQQAQRGRRRPNFMTDVVGMEDQEPVIESVSPGIPGQYMGSALPQGSGAVPNSVPTSNTMPVGQRAPHVPQGQYTGVQPPQNNAPQNFMGQGTGWRGLDTTPVSGPVDYNRFQGFNLDRALAGSDPNSTKDAYARFAAGITTPLAGLSKEQIDDLLTSQIDRARQMGLNILDVQGDKILIDAKEHGPVWTDGVADAGGKNPQWWWNPELGDAQNMPQASPANEMYSKYQQMLMPPQEDSQQELEQLIMMLMQGQV